MRSKASSIIETVSKDWSDDIYISSFISPKALPGVMFSFNQWSITSNDMMDVLLLSMCLLALEWNRIQLSLSNFSLVCRNFGQFELRQSRDVDSFKKCSQISVGFSVSKAY